MLINARLVMTVLCTGIAIVVPSQVMATIDDPNVNKAQITEAFGQLPLSFEANQGQTDASVKYLSRGPGYALFLTATEAVMALHSDNDQTKTGSPANAPYAVLRMKIMGANTNAKITGDEMLAGKSHYLMGKDAKHWRTDVPTYAKVRYENIYSGINLVYYGNQGQLEYDFVLSKGADPNTIHLSYDGVDKLSVDKKGNLILSTKGGDVVQHAPVIYQEINGKKKEIVGSYLIKSKKSVGFKVAAYNIEKPLVIDPVLVYSTYLGGSSFDQVNALVVGNDGRVLVAGDTSSLDFPTLHPIQGYLAGNSDAFVTEFKPNGNGIVYSTFLGGSSRDRAFGISTEDDGDVFITGETLSSNFPITSNAYQQFPGGGPDMFVIALDSKGKNIKYSTYLGGSVYDIGFDIVAGNNGMVYVSGQSRSADFPVKNAIQPGYAGWYDAIVAKIDTRKGGSDSVVFATYFGGDDWEEALGIDLDSDENIYIVGDTASHDFPTTPGAYQEDFQSYPSDVFVTKFSTNGDSLLYSTHIGSPIYPEDNDNPEDPYDIWKEEEGWAIDVDDAGYAYVTGFTDSADFPYTPDAYHSDSSATPGKDDVFITKLNLDGSGLVYSAIVGGAQLEKGTGIGVDKAGSPYITGWTLSTDFPMRNPFQETLYGRIEPYVTKLTPDGSDLDYSTYFGSEGGPGGGRAWGIAVDDCQNAYIGGQTSSQFFPTTKVAFQTYNGGSYDGFVTKFEGIPNCALTGN